MAARVVKLGKTQIVFYEPQLDLVDGVALQGRVAVSIQRPEDKASLFGALWVTVTPDITGDRGHGARPVR